MLEELKYALFAFHEQEIHCHFSQKANSIKFVHYSIVLQGSENEISVFHDPTLAVANHKSRFLNKTNTQKKFQSVPEAINYLKYLAKAATDSRYEQYHYFLFKLREIKLEYGRLNFGIVNDNSAIRCDMGELVLGGKPLKYNFVFVAYKNRVCNLTFYPENPIWDEGKPCPEAEVDGIVKYISHLDVDDYDGIALKEE